MSDLLDQLDDEQLWPEHEKLHAVVDRSQAIGEFIEWIESQGFTITAANGGPRPNMTTWLADFFGIDLDRIETEKRAMIGYMRAQQDG